MTSTVIDFDVHRCQYEHDMNFELLMREIEAENRCMKKIKQLKKTMQQHRENWYQLSDKIEQSNLKLKRAKRLASQRRRRATDAEPIDLDKVLVEQYEPDSDNDSTNV